MPHSIGSSASPEGEAPDRKAFNPQALGAALVDSAVVALAAIRRCRIVFANPAFVATFRQPGALVGLMLADIVSDAGGDRLDAALAAAESTPTHYFGIGRRGAEPPFDVSLTLDHVQLDGALTIVAFAADVTDQSRSRQQLSYLAYSDTLTGLANRALFADRLHHTLLVSRRDGTPFAVLMVDLDGFKAVNDSLGHDAGDVTLQLVSQRFQACVREGDTLARVGGDEFAVLLPRMPDLRTASLVAQRLVDVLAAPLDVGAHQMTVGASIGIAAWPAHAGSGDALLAAADTAMYRAKRCGKNQFQWADGRAIVDLVSLTPVLWNAAHAVGIAEIDGQHRHLAGLIDQLSAALKDGGERQSIVDGLDALIRFTTFHFATEERLMGAHRLVGQERHREEHRRLLQDICNLNVDGEVASISLILRYLREWLLRHIDSLDRHLGQALLAKGCQ